MEQRNDDMLFQITQQAGNGVNGLLDALFGFLQRRTDFFYQMEPGEKMGFPPGIAESMVYQHFKKYQDVHFKKFPPKPETEERWKQYNENQQKLQLEKQAKEKELKEQQQNQVQNPSDQASQPIQKEEVKTQEKKEEKKPAQPAQPVEKKKIDEKMEMINTYNGAKTDRYNWSQGITEVVMQIRLPQGTKPKMLDVQIKAKSLSVSIKGQPPIVKGELCEKIKVEDSFWSVEDEKFLNINFEKAYEAIWKCAILGDDEIDTKTVDNSKRVEEFDLETQGHLQKVLYEQERKKRGLLTTEEEEQRKMMDKLMENNPQFQGMPYDPKKYGRNEGNTGPSPPFNF